MARLRGDERARYVRRMFGRISLRYDLLNSVMSGGRHYAWRRLAARDAASTGLRGDALDVACGTGDFALDLVRIDGINSVVGVDFAPQMLALARRKANRQHLSAQTAFVTSDAHTLPFPNDAFVCATVGFGVRNFIDVQRALSEMARVVRPGGRVVVLEIVRLEGSGLRARALPWCFRRAAPLLGALLARDAEAYAYLPESVEAFLSAQELAAAMEHAGLRIVRHRPLALGCVAAIAGEVV